ncbi:MAG: glutaredoxin domain-containing protein [Bacteroidota bacterium]|nr:glutaredoxin domain-containing protein [Bacteroidota bacterium]
MKVKRIHTLLVAILCILGTITSLSAQDSLLLYTRATCSNCQAVKRTLINNQINFIEKDLADKHNALKMLQKLKTVHYNKDINLPVIFLNNRLYHPAYQTPTGLTTLDIAGVMDTLLHRNQRGELHLTSLQLVQQPARAVQSPPSESDCSVQVNTPTVLVIAEFKVEADAKNSMQKLIKEGYCYAGIVHSNGIFRVYSKLFLKTEIAEQELKNTRKYTPDCYLLEVRNEE